MNIFVLDKNTSICAQYHSDKHVIKMLLEGTQILSTVIYQKNKQQHSALELYRPTHINHPCVKWASESLGNFLWLVSLGDHLTYEYTFRYGKIHKCQKILDKIYSVPFSIFDKQEKTSFALCMPDKYKTGDPVESYRNYYKNEKKHLLKYTKREIPYWL
jgi:hypothetical protein